MEDTPNEPYETNEPIEVALTRHQIYYRANRDKILARIKAYEQRVITDPVELEQRRLKNSAKCARHIAKKREKSREYKRVKQLEYYHKRRSAAKESIAAVV